MVTQDHSAYNAIDHEIWRFTLRHTHAVLRETAHPAYRDGLEKTGITLDRIPRVDEMDRRLSDLGWGAVCVDGFIPPRAFQQLQGCSILPIAAEIRSLEHLAYTPAPDIIHEAAGHAPVLADPQYASFLRAIGEVGYRSFALPHDDAVYQAIYALSVVKERAGASDAEVRASEQALADAVAAVDGVSEAARVARLYWWTVEYGLVGTPADYAIYGAGLLSSLGESHFCHAPEVKKRVLDASCIGVDYDITRAQPQLFVARDFAHLREVLGEVERGLSQAIGGVSGLATAARSGEVGTVELASGLQISGRVLAHQQTDGRATAIGFAPGWALSVAGVWLPGYGPGDHVRRGLTLALTPGLPAAPVAADASVRAADGELLAWRAAKAVPWEGAPAGSLALAAPCVQVVGVAAGPACDTFFPPSPASDKRVPARAPLSPERRELLALYERAQDAWRSQLGQACIPLFEALHARLVAAHPREWLLRFHLLESLITLGERSRLTRELTRELQALEHAYGARQPIATALAGLGS